MQKSGKNEQGFTLIETIAVILLAGIISAVLGMAIVQGVKSYVFGRTNVTISQKAQLAIARMERELRTMTAIDPDNSNADCIRYKRENASQYYRAIGVHADSLRMNVTDGSDASCPSGGNPGNILTDRVADFSFSYKDNSGSPPGASPPDSFENLRSVHISLKADRQGDSRAEDFNLVVCPRNNGLLNAPGKNE